MNLNILTLKNMGTVRNILFMCVITIYGVLGLITYIALENNVFLLEIFLMRLTTAVLILIIYLLALKVIKVHEGCLKEKQKFEFSSKS